MLRAQEYIHCEMASDEKVSRDAGLDERIDDHNLKHIETADDIAPEIIGMSIRALHDKCSHFEQVDSSPTSHLATTPA